MLLIGAMLILFIGTIIPIPPIGAIPPVIGTMLILFIGTIPMLLIGIPMLLIGIVPMPPIAIVPMPPIVIVSMPPIGIVPIPPIGTVPMPPVCIVPMPPIVIGFIFIPYIFDGVIKLAMTINIIIPAIEKSRYLNELLIPTTPPCMTKILRMCIAHPLNQLLQFLLFHFLVWLIFCYFLEKKVSKKASACIKNP